MTALTPKIDALGYWGQVATPALAVNLVSETTLDAARATGGLSNLRLYRKGGGDGVTQPAIGLSYSNLYLDADNALNDWVFTTRVGSTATADDFAVIANASDSNYTGLLYANAEANNTARFVSNWTIPENRAWCIRFFLFEKEGEQFRQVIAVMWGDWRLEIVDRSLQIMRKSAAWTQAQQDTLDDLLNVEQDADEAAATIIRQSIYVPETSEGVQVSEHKIPDIGIWFELTFIPEPRGVLNIVTDDDETAVEVPAIVQSRAVGVLWPVTNVTITTTGGAMFWQVGFPQFALAGKLLAPRFKWWYETPITSTPPGPSGTVLMTFRGQTDYSPPGTGIAFSLNEVPNSIEYQVQADLTGDGAYSPFLYAVEGFVPAGARGGSDTVAWSSDSVADFAANGQPIKELTPQYESEMKRRSCTITIRNRDGNLLLPGTYQQALHDRICNVTLGGDAFITRGIVRNAQLSSMKKATANQAQVFVTNAWSELVLEISDQWAVMDTDSMTDNPKGDGLRLGAYIRLVLSGAGVKGSEMTGVLNATGRVLPQAAPGEDFLIQPGGEVSRGDYLRSLVLDWGMGLVLSISKSGIWTLAEPDETVKAAFTSNATSGYRILEPLDIVRDFGDTYNFFIAEGAEINGQRLRQTWLVQESLKVSLWKGYVGRIRRFPVISAEYCRTGSDLQWVLRSRVRNHAKLGRWFQFVTNFHKDLDIGDRITVDAVECVIERIEGGSIQYANDRMTLVCREVVGVGA